MRTRIGSEKQTPGTQWVMLSDINTDYEVQRPLDERWVDREAARFDPEALGVVHLSHRKDGTYHPVDGNRRVHATRKFLGEGANGQRIQAVVYEGLSRAEEAQLFVMLNNNRPVTRIEKFMKAVRAGFPTEAAINRIVESVGLKISPAKQDRYISAVGTLMLVYRGFSETSRMATENGKSVEAQPELLRSVLGIINSAWGGTADSLDGCIIEGLGRLLVARQRVLSIPDLIKKLAQYPGGAGGIIGKARGRRDIMGGRIGPNVADVIIEFYNRGRRVGAIKPLR